LEKYVSGGADWPRLSPKAAVGVTCTPAVLKNAICPMQGGAGVTGLGGVGLDIELRR
jgi:hypothetical protein